MQVDKNIQDKLRRNYQFINAVIKNICHKFVYHKLNVQHSCPNCIAVVIVIVISF